MNGPSPEMIELFLQEASEHLQFLREYSGILQDPYPLYEDIERLYISAHGVAGTAGTYGYPLFNEVAGKLAHIFQYAMNATISAEATAPLVEFIYEAIAVLESDLIMVSANGVESLEDIAAFKLRYPFAFQGAPPAAAGSPTEQPHPPEPQAAGNTYGDMQDVAQNAAQADKQSDLQSAPSPAEVPPQLHVATDISPVTPPAAPVAPPPAAVTPAEESAAPLAVPPSTPPPVADSPKMPVATDGLPVPPPAVSAEPPVSLTSLDSFLDQVPELEPDEEIPAEVLEFFVPEVEEHLQAVTDCLLALEANPNEEDIHRLFRSMHTIKGSAAQVGWQRIATIAHRAEDLVGRLRDGELRPSATIVDLCLETVDVLKKVIYRQWEDEAGFQLGARMLIARLDRMASVGEEAPAVVAEPAAETVAALPIETLPIEAVPNQAEAHEAAELGVEAAPLEAVELEVFAGLPVEAEPLPGASPLDEIVAAFEPPDESLFAQLPAQPQAAAELAAAVNAAAPAMPDVTAGAGQTAAVSSLTPVAVAQSKSVRIALERLDRMMNAVGELVINRTRMLGRLAELEKLAEVLNFSKGRMSEKVTEFQDKYEFSSIGAAPALSQWPGAAIELADGYGSSSGFGGMRGAGFGAPGMGHSGYGSAGYGGAGYGYGGGSFDASPSDFSELEMDRYDDFGILSRSLTEISADITEVLTQLDGFVRRVDGDIDEFTKLAHRLQDEITQARMVPIGNLYTRIARTVRDAAKASNKQVELTLAGAETELDNNIIQQIADPLLHLVRNSVAHGIERVDERYEAGKPDQGNIAVRAYHKGNHIYVEVEDDGRGVDFERVKAAGVERGFISADDAERAGRRELLDLLFRPGFSTSPRRTELAGRGVGLDVVQANLANLNGEIEIETEKGFGTRFTLKVPLTLIISQALFVQCGQQTFAFPLGFVEEIRRIRPSEIEEVGGKLITKVRDVVTEVVRFDEALQLPRLQPINGYLRLVLVNVGGRQVGVVVEEVLRKDEIVIKNLGEYLRQVKLFPGATIAPDGSLILLVDINRLIMGESIERRPLTTALNAARLFLPGATAVARGEIPAAAMDVVEREKLVVLADDSISVRKFVGRMLEKAGYRVKLACDGLEALEIATSNHCDLVITDLEMPRTNGYELMMHLRQTPSTSKVPVMVVTSRAGAKHRDRALKDGAAAFMVKPVQEETFVAQVVELIGTSGQAMAAPPVVQ
jgi:chemotaxis protein histidine kinase CheA/ActR/RegA family two-component response regulator